MCSKEKSGHSAWWAALYSSQMTISIFCFYLSIGAIHAVTIITSITCSKSHDMQINAMIVHKDILVENNCTKYEQLTGFLVGSAMVIVAICTIIMCTLFGQILMSYSRSKSV